MINHIFIASQHMLLPDQLVLALGQPKLMYIQKIKVKDCA